MRLWGKLVLIVLPWALLTVFGYVFVVDTWASFWDGATHEHSLARADFFADLAYTGCVGPEAVIAEAEERAWFYQRLDEPLAWCHAPVGLSGWIHVNVSPPLPFSTEGENAAYIGFDENGCMARWQYTRGPGSTCPDF